MTVLLLAVFLRVGSIVAERTGVCAGSVLQNLSWNGMNQRQCFQRAVEVNAASSCGFLSISFLSNDQIGCWCFEESQCEQVESSPDGFAGNWTTVAISELVQGSTTLQRSVTAAFRFSAALVPLVPSGWCKRGARCNIGFQGMSREQCFVEAMKKQRESNNCRWVSYSGSASPRQQNKFCQCIHDCKEALVSNSEEDWETLPVFELSAVAVPVTSTTQGAGTSSSTSAPINDDRPSTTVSVANVAASTANRASSSAATLWSSAALSSLVPSGWCNRGDRRNIGFRGMSREQCFVEAMRRHRENNGCRWVSYSGSLNPRQQNKFCQCIRDCKEALASKRGEDWQTFYVRELVLAVGVTVTSNVALQESPPSGFTSTAAPISGEQAWYIDQMDEILSFAPRSNVDMLTLSFAFFAAIVVMM